MKFLQEGFLADFLSRLVDLLLLSVLWFLCSIPIVTIGASTCGVYAVTMKWAVEEEPKLIKTFFEAFRAKFKKGTILFLIFLALGLFIGLDLWSAFQINAKIRYLFIVVILAGMYFYLAVVSHVFPVAVYFSYGVKETIKKAFLYAMSNGVFTVFIMIINALPMLLIMAFPTYFGQILFLWFILGVGSIAYFSSMHLVRLFESEKTERLRM